MSRRGKVTDLTVVLKRRTLDDGELRTPETPSPAPGRALWSLLTRPLPWPVACAALVGVSLLIGWLSERPLVAVVAFLAVLLVVKDWVVGVLTAR